MSAVQWKPMQQTAASNLPHKSASPPSYPARQWNVVASIGPVLDFHEGIYLALLADPRFSF